MKRGDVVWADLGPPGGRKPVCIVTRDPAIEVLSAVTCAPIARTTRGIRSEVAVGRVEGLPARSVINCDSVTTIPIAWLDREPVGKLDSRGIVELDRALRYALGIQF